MQLEARKRRVWNLIQPLQILIRCWKAINSSTSSGCTYIPIRHNIITTCLIMLFPFIFKKSIVIHIQDSTRPLKVFCGIWHHRYHISNRSFKSCKLWVEPPWIGLLCPAHPTDVQLDWDLGNMELKSTPQTPALAQLWLRNTVSIKGCIWSAGMLRWLVRVKVTSTCMAMLSSRKLAKSIITVLPWNTW